MADFSFLSDTDDSAVEEILAEAADHVALKQISTLNLSAVSDSVLPQHLESRFRRLKTFPSSQPQPPTSAEKPSLDSAPKLTESTHTELGSSSEKTPVAKSRSGSARRRRSRSPSPSSSSRSSTSWLENKSSPKSKAEKGFGSVSPPSKKTESGWGCLWCSPKKALRKMSFTKRSGGGGGNDGVLEGIEGLGSLSRKEQEKILKRAAKEEMKVSEEAEKIVKWAKQVSARMEAVGVADDDDDDELHYK